MFSLCCVFTGTLILIRPAHAIALYTGSYLLFYIAMALTQKNPVILAINQAQGFAAAALGLLLAFLLWRKHTVTTLLQQQLQASNEELQRQKQQLEILSQLDALTGLYNRREFDRLANIELVRAKREGSDTAIIMADLDFFKRINDCFGHPTGDEVIQKTAETLSQNIRASDIVAVSYTHLDVYKRQVLHCLPTTPNRYWGWITPLQIHSKSLMASSQAIF